MAKATPANRDVWNDPRLSAKRPRSTARKNTLKGWMEAARPAQRAAGRRAFSRHLIGTGGMT